MLDEPSMGLAPVLVELIFDIIKMLNDKGVTILLVEQNALMAPPLPTVAMCCKMARSCSATAPSGSSAKTNPCRRPTWGVS